MAPFKRNFLQHALAVRSWMARNSAKGGIEMGNLRLQIYCRGQTRWFAPQFTTRLPDASAYAAQLSDEVQGFAGWRPYASRSWPASRSKIAFKRLCAQQGLRSPSWSQDLSQFTGVFLVKRDQEDMGSGLRGPYRTAPTVPASSVATLAEGEYAEQFMLGRLLKAWFWGPQLLVTEIGAMPCVRGDGHTPLQALIRHALPASAPMPEPLDMLLGLQGLQRDTVLPAEQTAVVDYRYLSPLNPAATEDHDQREQLRGARSKRNCCTRAARCCKPSPPCGAPTPPSPSTASSTRRVACGCWR